MTESRGATQRQCSKSFARRIPQRVPMSFDTLIRSGLDDVIGCVPLHALRLGSFWHHSVCSMDQSIFIAIVEVSLLTCSSSILPKTRRLGCISKARLSLWQKRVSLFQLAFDIPVPSDPPDPASIVTNFPVRSPEACVTLLLKPPLSGFPLNSSLSHLFPLFPQT